MSDKKKKKVWTIKKVLFWTSNYFKKHDIESPKFNAEMILSKVLELTRVNLYLHYDEVLKAEKLAAIKKIITKRAEHYPLQYLLGKTEFYGHKIIVDKGVLIPRPETEILVDTVVTFMEKKQDKKKWKILDLGTGTGIIPISINNYFDNNENALSFTVTDISPHALEICQKNLSLYKMENVEIINSDLFENIEGKFDIIISNPPYIAEDEWENLPAEIRDHEPKDALLAGEKGLKFYRKIMHNVGDYLMPEARVFLEIGAEQGEEVAALIKKYNYELINITKDINDRERVVTFGRTEK